MAIVYLNGEQVGQIISPPYELELPMTIKPGENTISVEVIGSLKNTFGFFYKSSANRWIIGPGDWDAAPATIPAFNQYFLPDYGLFEPFSLVLLE
jgi:hypothetical protein